MKDNDFLDVLKEANVAVQDDYPTTGFIDTGSYALNALVSASVYGGMPNNRATMFAGAPSAGKSFLTLACVKQYMDDNKDASVLYFDTEFALEKAMIAKREIDTSRFFLVQTDTLQDFRTKAINVLEKYESQKNKKPLMICLDSLSNLPTQKEVADSLSGHEARDMTKAQVIRSIFRVITNKLGKNNVPMFIANHIYSSMDMYSPVVISGGSGALYSASTVITLNKSKDKDDEGDVVGNIIRATTYKSRYSKENQKAELKLDFQKGLDRYYGLIDLAEKYGIIKKVKTRYEMPDGSLHFGKAIRENPERFYTKDMLDKLDVAAKREYSLGDVSEYIPEVTTENDVKEDNSDGEE